MNTNTIWLLGLLGYGIIGAVQLLPEKKEEFDLYRFSRAWLRSMINSPVAVQAERKLNIHPENAAPAVEAKP